MELGKFGRRNHKQIWVVLAGISYEQKVPRKMGSFKHQAVTEKTKGEFNGI